jgi:hypothetical protein
MKRTYTCVPDAIHTLHNAWSVPGANVHVRFCREGGEKQRIGCLTKAVLRPLREEAFLADPLVQLGQVIVIVEANGTSRPIQLDRWMAFASRTLLMPSDP